MYPNRPLQAQQQKRVRSRAVNTDAYDFFNVLTGPELLECIEAKLPEHRERLFPPTETLSMFLAQALSEDRSCQRAVNEASIKRLIQGMSPCSTHTGAYCRARKRLPTEMVRTLVHDSGQLIADRALQTWQWRGRAVKLVDGTTLSMPDTPANQAAYPQSRTQQPGLGFPLCRMVGLVCLGSGALLNAALGRFRGKGGDEQTLLRSMLDTLDPTDILLGDAYYSSYFLLCELVKRQVDGVFEQYGARRRSTDFRCGKRLGTRDHLIDLTKPTSKPDWMTQADYDAAPTKLTVRELRVGGKTLVTTLLCPKTTSKDALKNLYRQRWHVELDLRNIKTTLGLNTLTCKTPSMVEKEVWVYLLAYNLIRLIMAQAAALANRPPRELSFKHTLQLWTMWNRCAGFCDDKDLATLFTLIAQQQVGNRPGRIEPRVLKRRLKPYRLLTKPRHIMIKALTKNGHPKRLK